MRMKALGLTAVQVNALAPFLLIPSVHDVPFIESASMGVEGNPVAGVCAMEPP